MSFPWCSLRCRVSPDLCWRLAPATLETRTRCASTFRSPRASPLREINATPIDGPFVSGISIIRAALLANLFPEAL